MMSHRGFSIPRRSPSVILSINPRFADRIYSGTKMLELRKSLPRGQVQWCFLLETDRVRAVTGFFRCRGTFQGPVESILELARRKGVTPAAVRRYFRGLNTGRAMLIGEAHRFKRPIALRDLRVADQTFLAPHTFAYLGGLSAAARELFFRRLLDLGHAGGSHAVQLLPASTRAAFAYREMALQVLSSDYGEIDSDFATQLTASASEPGTQFFTQCKICIRAFHGARPLGYTTVTIKRGGAVKTGPTVLLARHRQKSRGVLVQQALADLVAAAGFHKLYCTCPSSRHDVLRYLLKSGFQVEAHLQRHYAADHDEFVMGKLIWRPAEAASHTLSRLSADRFEIGPSATSWEDFLQAVVGAFYCKDPRPLAEHMMVCRPLAEGYRYSQRPKSSVVGFSGEAPVAALILSPKRGGSMRCTPLLCTSDAPTLKRAIAGAERVCRDAGRRKLTVLSPMQWSGLQRALAGLDFELEGVLRCPYQYTGDCAVYSKFFS